MALLTLAGGLALIAANLWLYRRQRVRYPEMQRPDRRPYRASLPTRLFARIKIPFYLLLVAHLALEAFVLEPEGPPAWRAAVGLGLGACGLAVLFAALEALGGNFAPCDRAVLPFERVRSGPYRVLDHPVYAGNLLLFTGLAVASFGPLIVACWTVVAVVYGFAIRDEDRALRAHFDGDPGSVPAALPRDE